MLAFSYQQLFAQQKKPGYFGRVFCFNCNSKLDKTVVKIIESTSSFFLLFSYLEHNWGLSYRSFLLFLPACNRPSRGLFYLQA